MTVCITEDILEENICKALSLTGVNVVPNDLRTCHQMKSLDRVIQIQMFQAKKLCINIKI